MAEIVKLQPELAALKNVTLLDCDLSDNNLTEGIVKVYQSIYSINGLWLTGVSKITHLLNDNLFALLNLDISNHFKLLEGTTSLVQWLKSPNGICRKSPEISRNRGFPVRRSSFYQTSWSIANMVTGNLWLNSWMNTSGYASVIICQFRPSGYRPFLIKRNKAYQQIDSQPGSC